MAAHRKPKQNPLAGPAARTAATLALASAATATAFEGGAHAEPALTPAQIKAKVDQLYQEAEAAAEKHNGAQETTAKARRELDQLRDQAARKTEKLNASRDRLGSFAAAQYRAAGMDPGMQLALTSDPDEYLERAELAGRVGELQAGAIAGVHRQLVEIGQLKARAEERVETLRTRQSDLARHKTTARDKLAAARRMLDRLTAEQRAAYEGVAAGESSGAAAAALRPSGARVAQQTGAAAPSAPAQTSARTPAESTPKAADSRAAQAVSYAYGALGKPYVWGATGPSSFDCSGLTQAAWRSAGVSLPRTTYTQINAGRRVTRSQLAPGDLVFFYSGVSHVGIYIGNGQMIHAPRPGDAVRIAPIDQMPFAGASRPA
ncbi:NlpC/P60 family protein [Streptomyces sp. HNM0663]|uniref:NlpC/P60 family protein n=1 Tax=Streptomyces chengmaiensis TaxID=3040919 RepID=A0ABT6HL77_9ACTN|nr:NlpC/P60 family protein [Streptomyces chengmaiensis]MDH2389489.1 NlpC/P60 family protein [Streptomyces chengmaiensis]